MTEAEFETTYRHTLLTIEDTLESAIEEEIIDLDYETINDILSIEFEDGSAVIITKQGATQQLWLAAVSGGFHFAFDESSKQWCSTIDQQSLSDKMREVTRLQSGVDLQFS